MTRELLSSRHVSGNRTVGDYSGTGREGGRALIRQSEKPYINRYRVLVSHVGYHENSSKYFVQGIYRCTQRGDFCRLIYTR